MRRQPSEGFVAALSVAAIAVAVLARNWPAIMEAWQPHPMLIDPSLAPLPFVVWCEPDLTVISVVNT